MERQIAEIQHLATKYSKAELGRMVQMGLIDPQRAMMAGMMIDRIQKQNAQPPQTTVAQDVLGLPAVAPQAMQQPQMQQPQSQMQQPQAPLQGTGVEQLPAGEVGNYAGGGIVAFDDGGEVEGYAKGDLVPSGLFEALVQAESRGKHSAVSSKGARGAAQLMPGTMRDPGYGIEPVRNESLEENLRVGREYLGAMMKKYRGNVDHALAAYNWGPGNVDKWLRRGGDPSELPRETKTYIPRVKNFMAQQRQEPAPVRVAERRQMDEESLAGVPAGRFMPVESRVGMPSLLRRPLERITNLLPSAGAGGIEDLPAGMQPRAEYASGGITAFQRGGLNMPSDLQTPFDTSGGSNTVYGMNTTDVFRPRAPEEETSSMFGRGVRAMGSTIADVFSGPPGALERYGAQQDVLARQRALRARLQQLEGYGFGQQTKAQQAEAEQIRKELSALEGQLRSAARTQSAPPSGPSGIVPYKTKTVDGVKEDQFPLETYQERLARRQTGVGYTDPKTGQIVKEGEAPEAAPSTEPALPPIARPKLRGGTFEDYLAKATPKVSGLDIPQDKSITDIGKERRAAYAAEGYDPEVFTKMIAGIEKKKGEAATEKDSALGHAVMMAGFKLMGARKGQEFQTFSEGAQEGLKNYQGAMKDLRARQERYDERIEALRAADMQARRTGAESDITRRDNLAAQTQAAKLAVFQAKNNAAAAGVQAAASMTTADQNNAVQIYAAELQARTAREYTAALKAQQIEATKAKILVDAAGDYISKNAANPKYLQDPGQLQADAIAYANSIGAQFGVIPKGANMAPPAKPNAAAYEKQYSLQPINPR
jgi:hypothetical protein